MRVRLSRQPSRVAEDGGAATVLAAIMVAALVSLTLGGVWIGAAVVARHRAQTAADLAALAAAASLMGGPTAACRQAGAVTEAMGAALGLCRIEQLDVVVAVTVRPGGWAAGEASAAARAGPAVPRR